MSPKPDKMSKEGVKVVAQNRVASYNYTLLERYEAGLVLLGTEVKSLREGKATLRDAYAEARGGDGAFKVGWPDENVEGIGGEGQGEAGGVVPEHEAGLVIVAERPEGEQDEQDRGGAPRPAVGGGAEHDGSIA